VLLADYLIHLVDVGIDKAEVVKWKV